jgi:hypothetical protein
VLELVLGLVYVVEDEVQDGVQDEVEGGVPVLGV